MCGNVKLVSSVDQDISRVSKANEDILFNTRNNFIFPNIHVLFCLLYKKISPIINKSCKRPLRRQSRDTNRNIKRLVYSQYG